MDQPRPLGQEVSVARAGVCGRLATPESSIRVLLSGARISQQRLTRELLASLQVDSRFAQDAVEASELTASEAFDVVLVDVDASLLESLFVMASIRRFERETHSPRATPVVAYTGIEPPTFEVLLKHTGANDVLRKSSAAAGMRACLARWCPQKFERRSL